ncbi:MAG TPA: polysaccharide deacetylase family protein [Gemmatimonadales bacterium]|nr:polysaccharide deacetylase family protein [Gemmatimonadales bacterium]
MRLGPELASFGYHEVTDDPTASGFQRPAARPYKHTRQAFQHQLAALARARLAPELVLDVDLEQPGRHLLLTFDDGGKSALHVSDELSRRGWKGHFFIVTSLIGSRTFLDRGEIRSIRSAGHLIGSHSHTHPDIFRDLTPARMAAEWRTSCDLLEDLLGEPCRVASVPGGDISGSALRSAARVGLRYLFTSEPWTRPRQVDGCWILGRFGPKTSTSPARTEALARFRGWSRALLVRRATDVARRALPTLYRLYVRQRTREWAAS